MGEHLFSRLQGLHLWHLLLHKSIAAGPKLSVVVHASLASHIELLVHLLGWRELGLLIEIHLLVSHLLRIEALGHLLKAIREPSL